jgi:transcriptional regulator with XRE-family HTH domain
MLSDRLQFAMRRAGLSQAELARACGVKAPSVHSWLSGKSKYLRGPNLLTAAKVLGVSQTWLATGKGSFNPLPHEDGSLTPDMLSLEDCLNKLEAMVLGLDDLSRQDVGFLLDLFVRRPSPMVRQILLETIQSAQGQNPT